MKPHPVRSASLIFTLTLLLFLPSLLYAAEVTEQNLRDAITGKRTFTQEELNVMDEKGNGDGQVDVADLVVFIRSNSLQTVSFLLPQTEADEAAGAIPVSVIFARPFSGTVFYTVSGTAVAGNDYAVMPGQFSVSDAGESTITVTLINNPLPQRDKTILLTLTGNKDNGLAIGLQNTHVIRIQDADPTALLLGEFAGTMAPEGQDVMPDLSSNFGMCSVNMSIDYDAEQGRFTGKIETDDKSLSIYFPRNDAGYPLTFTSVPDHLFSATAEYTTPQSNNSFGRDLNGKIMFMGNFSEEDDSLLTGTFTETIENALFDKDNRGGSTPRSCQIKGAFSFQRIDTIHETEAR